MQAESVLIDQFREMYRRHQIPNQLREQISLRSLLESERIGGRRRELTIALGKTITVALHG